MRNCRKFRRFCDFLGLSSPLAKHLSRSRAYSCPESCQFAARHPKAGQRKQRDVLSRAFLQVSIEHARKSELALDHPKWVFHPTCRGIRSFSVAPIASTPNGYDLLFMQQGVSFCDIAHSARFCHNGLTYEKCISYLTIGFLLVGRQKSASSPKLPERKRAHLVKMTVPANSIIKTLNVCVTRPKPWPNLGSNSVVARRRRSDCLFLLGATTPIKKSAINPADSSWLLIPFDLTCLSEFSRRQLISGSFKSLIPLTRLFLMKKLSTLFRTGQGHEKKPPHGGFSSD